MIRLALTLLLLAWAACAEAAPCTIEPIEIFGGALTTTPGTVIYGPVAAGKKLVVTSILISNKNTTTVRNVNIESFGGAASLFPNVGVAANVMYAEMTGVVLNAGRTITAWQTAGTDVTLILSGALYTC